MGRAYWPYIILTSLLIYIPTVWAGELRSPPPLRDETASEQLYFREIYNHHNNLVTVTTDPDGSRSGMKGDILWFDSDPDEICVNTDGATAWSCAVATTFSEKTWAFKSDPGAVGTTYYGGYYFYSGTNNDFAPAINFGTANIAYGAHFFVVTGAQTVDAVTITVTGTSMLDTGVRAAADTETISIPTATAVNSYFETVKKWIGQISINTTAGTAIQCNYGLTKYWDNNNRDFAVVGVDVTWFGGANDANPNIILRHHNATGWTYNAGADPTPPAAITSMAADYNTEIQVANNENGAWKRDNLTTAVEGSGEEGTIVEIVTTANRAFEFGNFLLRIEQ